MAAAPRAARRPDPPRAVGDRLVVGYEAPPEATALVVAARPIGSDAPAITRAFALDAAHGEVELPADDGDVRGLGERRRPGRRRLRGRQALAR